jgi:rhodanese-related sulfurtransferase
MTFFSPWLLSGIFLLTLTAILSIVYFFKQPRTSPVRPKVARALLRDRHVAVIDVRTEIEWNTGHYPHAYHIPEITRLPHVIQDRATTLLLYCRTGRRAEVAAQDATGLGYKSVYYLVDGSYEDLNI